jgi:hypothetical protein
MIDKRQVIRQTVENLNSLSGNWSIFVCLSVGQIPFQVSSVANVTAVYGRNATLRCPYENNQDEMTVSWNFSEKSTHAAFLDLNLFLRIFNCGSYFCENKDLFNQD